MTIPVGPTWGEKLTVNLKLLGAVAYGGAAWAVWPTDDPKLWAFGALSFILALAATILGGKAVSQMITLYRREKQLREQLSKAREPEPARLADTKRLQQAGMIDG